jgi:glutamate racemase
MIGVFDSGLGGLTVLRALIARFPNESFVYLGDHAHMPYGDRPSEHIVGLTQACTEHLFERGCRLVLIGCNTATAVAARTLQRNWLPQTIWKTRGHNILGIVAPTVEAATQTPWAVTTPKYPQSYISDRVAIFGTTRTVSSNVYRDEIRKRCPKVRVLQQACSELAAAIEHQAPREQLETLVTEGIDGILEQADGKPPDRVILGCTHFPLVEEIFREKLPPSTTILSQPEVVADSLEDYLARRSQYVSPDGNTGFLQLLTTGDPQEISVRARVFWPESPAFEAA